MDQLTWMMGFIPGWIWNLTLILSIVMLIVSWIFKFIPFVGTYRLPLQVVGVILSITSVWFLGAASNEAKWEARVEEYKNKIIELEKKQKETNIIIVEKIVKEKEYIKGSIGVITETIEKWNTNEIIKEVPVERVKIVKEYLENCPIPKEFIELHNKAATIDPKAEGAKK